MALLGLSGCATVAPDRGLGDVRALLNARDAPLAARPNALNSSDAEIAAQLSVLLKEPLTAERAVAVALLRNPALRIEYARLGLVQADVVEASRLSNPVFSFAALHSNVAGDRTRLDYGLVQNFTGLLFLHSRSAAAQLDLQGAKANAGAAIQNLAAEVSRAYYQLAGATQLAQMRAVIAKAGATASELALRFHAAGNISALQLNREQASATQAQLDSDAAQATVAGARSALRSQMGLRASEDDWQLAAQLPLPVEQEESAASLCELAYGNRLDLAAKRKEAEAYAGVLGLANSLRWLPLVEVGIQGERDNDGARLLGPTVALELPLFGKSRSGLLRAEAHLEQARAEAAVLEASVGNEVTAAYAQMLAARARVQRYQTQLIPQREAVVARMAELQNYMIIGQFELLVAKQQEYEAYQNQLQALSDYWIARTALARAVGAKLPSDVRIGQPSAAAVVLPDAAATGSGHADHGMKGMDGMDMPMEDMPGMKGMDHSGHDMKGMAGMEHPGESPSADQPRQDRKTPKFPIRNKAHGHQQHHGDQP